MNNKLASWSFGMSICGLILLAMKNVPIATIIGLAFVLSGFIFGIKSFFQIQKSGNKGKGMAITSIIIGGIAIVIMAWVIIAVY